MLKREVERVAGPSAVRDDDQSLRPQCRHLLEGLSNEIRIAGDRLARAREHEMDGFSRDSFRAKLPRVLNKIFGHAFIHETANEHIPELASGPFDLRRDRGVAGQGVVEIGLEFTGVDRRRRRGGRRGDQQDREEGDCTDHTQPLE